MKFLLIALFVAVLVTVAARKGRGKPKGKASHEKKRGNNKKLSITIAEDSTGAEIGTFTIKMLKSKAPQAANDFAQQAIGETAPRTAGGRYDSGHTGGFVGMGTHEVFPQFETCNGNADHVKEEAQKGSQGTDPIQGKMFDDESYHVPAGKLRGGNGVLSIVDGNGYFIRGPNNTEIYDMSKFVDIGIICKQYMDVIYLINQFVCDNLSEKRKKRQNSATSITDITMK